MILELKLCFKGAFNKFLCGQGKNPNNLMRKNQNSKTKHVYGLKTAKVMNERFSIYLSSSIHLKPMWPYRPKVMNYCMLLTTWEPSLILDHMHCGTTRRWPFSTVSDLETFSCLARLQLAKSHLTILVAVQMVERSL